MKQLRLKALASFVNEEDSVLDVGTDHGYLPVCLRKQYPQMAIGASDVAEGPLKKCAETFAKYRIGDIPVYLSDGLKDIPKPYSCVIIAGMGGQTIRKILQEGAEYLQYVEKLIIEPNSEPEKARKAIREAGYRIQSESMIKEYKYYVLIEAQKCEEAPEYTEDEYIYGPCLMKEKPAIYREYLEKEYNKAVKVLEKLSIHHPDRPALTEKCRKIRGILD